MANRYQFHWQALDSMGLLQEGGSLQTTQDALLGQLADRGRLVVS